MEAKQRVYTYVQLIVQLCLHHQLYTKTYENDFNLVTGKWKEQNFILANLFINETELVYFNFRPKLLLTQCQQLPLLLINAEKIVEGKTVVYVYIIQYDVFRRAEVIISVTLLTEWATKE
jgi:hypothetical protein